MFQLPYIGKDSLARYNMDNFDEKSPLIISFILSLRNLTHKSPLFIALNGIQGIGKSCLGATLAHKLSNEQDLRTIVISIDDFYLTYADQLALGQANRSNKLLQHRGQPGTHDLNLAKRVLSELANERECQIPSFDKAAHHGNGDRQPQESWRVVNQTGDTKIQVIIIEGWCVGFSPLNDHEVECKRNQTNNRSLSKHDLNNLLFINEKLKEYEEVFNSYFDGFIHLDVNDLSYVYDWREEQEEKLRREKGLESAMSPQQIVNFVENFFPTYELYTEVMRQNGIISRRNATRLKDIRLVVDRNRKVLEIYKT